jgi:hypothetical protein
VPKVPAEAVELELEIAVVQEEVVVIPVAVLFLVR